jgi:hypothetical protein
MTDRIRYDKKKSIEISLRFVYWIFFGMIFISSAICYFTGYLGGDLEGASYPTNNYLLLKFSLIQLSGLILSYYFSIKLSKFSFSNYQFHLRNKSISFIAVLFSIVSAIIVISGGVGTIHRDLETSRYAELFFALFDPYTLNLLLIYYVFLKIDNSKKILYFLVIFYLFMIARSGFTGYLLFILPVLISILTQYISYGKIKLILAISVLMIPVLRLMKWVAVIGFEKLQDVEFDFSFFMLLTRGTIDRFSSVPNMIYIDDNALNLNDLLDTKYLPFFQSYFGSFIHKIIYSEPVALNTLFLHQSMQNTSTDSNAMFPLLSYFSLNFIIGVLSIFLH